MEIVDIRNKLKGMVGVMGMLKLIMVVFGMVVLTGCCGIFSELGNYTQPYLSNETLQNCVEGSVVDTYVTGKTTEITVTITKNYTNYCEVEYVDGNVDYIAKYDKNTGKICSYESQGPGMMSKSLSFC